MVAQFVSDLYLALSQDRLEAYRPTNGTDLEMLTNYFWNIDLAEAVVPSLHAAELALRNSLHTALTAHFGTDMWFYQPGVLDSWGLGQLSKALGQTAKKPPLLAGRLVATLGFGFWVSLLAGRYQQRIWQPRNFALLGIVFPHAAGYSTNQIHARFNAILELRNRVFHYEAIWHRPALLQEHTDIHGAIQWISPTLHLAINAVDDFPAIFDGKTQVEADLKKHLGIS